MDSTTALVVKVNHGGVLRRFSIPVNVNGQLDLDMAGLREKIVRLFNLPADAELTLTYIDEDGDVVNLVDDDDLHDVMNQRLKFLKITVHLNRENCADSSATVRTGNPTDPFTNIHKGINDILMAVPDPLRDTVSKISMDLASRAACTSPVVSEILERFSQLGQVARPQESNPSAPVVPNLSGDGGLPQKFTSAGPALSGDMPTPDNNLSDSKIPSHGDGKDNSRENQEKKRPATLNEQTDSADQKAATHESGSPGPLAGSNECPFSGNPVNTDPGLNRFYFNMHPRRSCHFKKSHNSDNRTSMGMFHKGIRCDGCGVLPITGPRFKSKVEEDYDLCSICFSEMDNKTDYIRMDKPIFFPDVQSFRGLCAPAQNPRFGHSAPPLPQGSFHFRLPRPKLDGRFVLDVNVLDGTVMAPSTPFTKIWRIRNNGSLVWPRGTQLVWIGGDKFSDSLSVDLEVPEAGVPIDGELDVAADFVAPESPGRYISYWRMASASGAKFGQRVWVLIHVDASLKDSVLNGFQGLDLNAPPNTSSSKGSVMIYVNGGEPVQSTGSITYLGNLKPVADINPKVEESNIPVNNNSSLVGEVTPAVPPSAVQDPSSSSVSYPIIDLTDMTQVKATQVEVTSEPFSAKDILVSPERNKEEDDVEQALLKELEEMGFKQIDLNKEILRKNDYDLEESVDELCGVSDWDPILEELQEMGFCDEEKNRRLLKKNNGSIKGVVMDLLTGEKA